MNKGKADGILNWEILEEKKRTFAQTSRRKYWKMIWIRILCDLSLGRKQTSCGKFPENWRMRCLME